MLNIIRFIAILTLSLSGMPALKAGEHLYLVTAHSPDILAIVDEEANVIWSVGSDEGVIHPQDAAVTDEGIFTSIMSGALMFSRNGKSVLWHYDTPGDSQNPVAQPLGNGYYLVGNEGPCRLLEIDKNGNTRCEITIQDPPFKGNHGQFRFCRKTPEGTYLFPMNGAGLLREYNSDGTLLREFPITGQPIGAVRLPNGNTLAGMDSAVKEYDAKMNVLWEFDLIQDGKMGEGLITSVCRLKNGNTLVSYYNNNTETPDIVEISPEKEIIRKVILPEISLVAGMELLDANGEPSEEILAR